MKRIKKGDQVVVIAGKEKGTKGEIKSVLTKSQRVTIDGVNLVKKHVKPNPQKGIQGGIVEKEAPIHVSNVMLVNPETNKPEKIGFKEDGGEKVRYFKSNNEVIA